MNDKKENIAHLDIKLPVISCHGSLKHHHETLVDMARDALGREEYDLTVILATAASEMLTERAFRLLFSFKGIDYLYDSVIDKQWEYNNITKKKNRNLYLVLSGDDIPNTFKGWSEFHKHYNRRHEIAHRGKSVVEDDARKSYKVVTEYIKHVESIIENLKPEDW